MARAVLACARPLFVPTVGGLRHVAAAAGCVVWCSAVRVESESDCWLVRRVECAAGAAQRGCTAWRHSTALRSSALVARSAQCCALRAARRASRPARRAPRSARCRARCGAARSASHRVARSARGRHARAGPSRDRRASAAGLRRPRCLPAVASCVSRPRRGLGRARRRVAAASGARRRLSDPMPRCAKIQHLGGLLLGRASDTIFEIQL